MCNYVVLWFEFVYFYRCYDEYDNVCEVMMKYFDVWEYVVFKDVCVKFVNADLYY